VLEVSSTGEYVVFVNMTTAEVDVSGWTVDFEYGSGGSGEQGTIPSGTTVQARDTIKVASGAGETPDDAVVVEDPYDEEVIDTDGNDVIALLDAHGNEVANSEDDQVGSGGGGDDDAGDETTSEEDTTTEGETTSTEGEETTITSDGTTSDDGTDQSDSDELDDTTEDDSGGSDDESGQMSSSSESDAKTDESSDDC
jgi:Lamin Tail Domain